MTAQIHYEDGKSNTVENVNSIDYQGGDFISIYGLDGGIIAKKSDVKRVYFVRNNPVDNVVQQEEVMKAEDA